MFRFPKKPGEKWKTLQSVIWNLLYLILWLPTLTAFYFVVSLCWDGKEQEARCLGRNRERPNSNVNLYEGRWSENNGQQPENNTNSWLASFARLPIIIGRGPNRVRLDIIWRLWASYDFTTPGLVSPFPDWSAFPLVMLFCARARRRVFTVPYSRCFFQLLQTLSCCIHDRFATHK